MSTAISANHLEFMSSQARLLSCCEFVFICHLNGHSPVGDTDKLFICLCITLRINEIFKPCHMQRLPLYTSIMTAAHTFHLEDSQLVSRPQNWLMSWPNAFIKVYSNLHTHVRACRASVAASNSNRSSRRSSSKRKIDFEWNSAWPSLK